jgi:transcription-repair coupling factor (superfamily II helicase)
MANLAKQYFFNSTPQNSEIFEVYKRFMNSKHSFLHICKNDFYLNNAKQFLKFFLKDTEILEIPAWDINPYDNVSPANEIVSKRLKSFSEIIRANNQGKKHIVLTTATAITQRNIPQDILANSARTISKGDEIDRDELTRFLVDNSYINIAAASDHGEFSIRGSIIDIFPPGKEYGLRLDFFGDEVESIREYDPLTQISRGNVDSFDILPAGEIILSEKNIEVFKTNFIKNFGIEEAEKNQIYNAITEGRKYSGMENYLPLFYENTDNLFDYCKDYIISFEQDSSTVLEERFEQIEDSYNARKIYSSSGGYESSASAALEPDKIYLTKDDIKSILNNREYYYFSKYNEESLDFLNGRNMVRHNLLYNPVKNFSVESKISSKNAFELVKEVLAEDIEQKSKRKNLIACLSQGSKERLKKMLAEHNISVVEIEDFEKEQLLISKGKVGLVEIAIDSGFENDKIRIITEPEILGDKVIRKSKSSKKAEDFIKEASNLESGELIVHQENGIGRFMGLETINIQNIEHDFIHLEYRDGDKFYVPVENIEMISRYGSNTENVELDKLGGANWQERAAKVKKRIKEIAGDLVDVAAKRQLRKGRVFDADSGAYDEFCSKFKYMETEDQLNAIDSVLGDLASGKPMDRLICGDVGFGKTEVALRASFAIIHKND